MRQFISLKRQLCSCLFSMLFPSACGFLISCGPTTSHLDSNEAKIRAFEDDLGVPLDYESAVVYAMGYEIGRRANPGTTVDQLVQIARQTSTGVPQFRKVSEAGMRDGLERRTSRIEGVKFDKSYNPSQQETPPDTHESNVPNNQPSHQELQERFFGK